MLLCLWACNSYPMGAGGGPRVYANPDGSMAADVGVPPPPPLKYDALRSDSRPNPFADTAPAEPDAPQKPTDGGPKLDTGPKPPDVQPDTRVETGPCPSGQVRVHIRDIWSNTVDPPSLKTMSTPPSAVQVIDQSNWSTYGARKDAANCTYYSVCLSASITKIQIKAVGADACPGGNQSGSIDLSSFKNATDIWIEYKGDDSNIQKDFSASPVTVGDNAFHITSDGKSLKYPACNIGTPPDKDVPEGFTKIHFRWPWNDPTDSKTPYPGSGCPASSQRDPVTKKCPFDLQGKMGFTVPPYPSSLKVRGFTCEMTAVLEFQDGSCPWYYVMVPDSAWPTTGAAKSITFRYPDESKSLFTNDIVLPVRQANTKEYWIAYAGAPDNTLASGTCCMDWSLQTNSYFVYTSNPGPGYDGCGGSVTPPDPCSPLQPTGYHTVHFRYLWAGQKTFTFFPSLALMPKWMELEVNNTAGAAGLKIICQREQDRPWYECPVPDSAFSATTTWRAVDKLHDPEWNTVQAWPLPATPKEYWIRWYYGKPDIPRYVDPPNFKVYDYYPDGSNGDWSATGDWNDSMCAPKPPATPVNVGFGNGAWFPYKRTEYNYPYGGSLAFLYPESAKVQDLFDAFVWERYQLWKQNWVKYDAEACGTGTASVYSTWPAGVVSEGLGYGMAISTAIGDKELAGKFWLFIRHFLSQGAKKYCGGLMGWEWKSTSDCRPLDKPCDIETEACGGTGDSAFDGDVDIAIGLVFAASQWPDDKPPQSSITWKQAAIDWLIKMECEVDTNYDGKWNYPSTGDTDTKNCQDYPNKPCSYPAGSPNTVRLDYYPPGYFRVFGDFLAANVGKDEKSANGQTHRDFWDKTAETVYEMLERCYDSSVPPALVGAKGMADKPCSVPEEGSYEELRALWRVGIDAAWFGDNASLPENQPGSSPHYGPKSRMQAKIDHQQEFFNNFYKKNPVEPSTNRFSSLCDSLNGKGSVTDCDSARGHNSYTVNMAMSSYVSLFNNDGKTTASIRREAIEEAVSTTVQNDMYFQESLGVYSMLFLTGNFPNPLTVPK
jgi:hypothetical protein